MSDDERSDGPEGPFEDDLPGDDAVDPAAGDSDPGLDTGESAGLGLTEEFARIEAEIESDAARERAARSAAGDIEGSEEPAVDGPGADPEPGADQGSEEPAGHDPDAGASGQREIRDDSGQGQETEDWAVVPESGEDDLDFDSVGDDDLAPIAGDEPEQITGDDLAPITGDDLEPVTGDDFEQVTGDDLEPVAAGGDGDAGSGDGSDGSDSADEPADGDGDADDDAEQADPATGEDAAQGPAQPIAPREPATVVQQGAGQRPIVRQTPAAAMAAGGLTFSDEELDIKVPKLWLRFLAGSVMIVVSIAAAVSVTGILFLSDVAAKLQPIPGIGEQLADVDPGAPQTILIIGSDRRAGDDPDFGARSDTTMLLRVDPDKEVLSLFSLPRDLKVDIPGVGVSKLNEAYAAGGEKKTLKTVKAFTGLDINHVVEINFTGFADAVDAIDCVYIDIDREYFNDNAGIASGTTDGFAEIDINAGYQRLCGLKALQYVRYRHTDTDLVRAARQQDFVREARQKVEPRELLGAVFGTGTGNELINIFTEYTRSDIDDEDDVIGILKSFAAMRDVPVNEVHFEGDIGGPTSTYVTSTDDQVKTAIDQFLNGVGSEGQRGGKDATEKKGGGGDKKKKKKKKKDPTDGAAVVGTDTLSDSKYPTMAERFAADGAKNARRLGIPVFYPTAVVPGSAFSTDSRTYEYENDDDKKESAYKTVISWTQPSTLIEYYGVMGTTWSDPPILRDPSEVRKIGGREYLLFYDGGRLRMVGWRERGNAYWLNNTLTQSIGEAEMLAIAGTMREV